MLEQQPVVPVQVFLPVTGLLNGSVRIKEGSSGVRWPPGPVRNAAELCHHGHSELAARRNGCDGESLGTRLTP